MKLVSYFNQYNVKLKTAIIGACIIGLILIFYAFFSVFFKSNKDKINSKNLLLNFNSYYAEYSITVNSNKTTSTYNIKEWYKKADKEMFKFEYQDFLNSTFSIVINGDKYKVQNMGQIAKYISVRNKENGINVYSLSSYINMINSSAFEVLKEDSEVTTKYTINISKILDEAEAEKFNDILNSSIKITRVEMLITINRPLKISIFSNKNEKIIIEYNNFMLNENLDESIFEV